MAQSKSPPKACATSANTKFLPALHALCALHTLRALHALCALNALHALLALHAFCICMHSVHACILCMYAFIALQKTGSQCVHKQKKQTGLKKKEKEEEEKELQWSFANWLSLRKPVKKISPILFHTMGNLWREKVHFHILGKAKLVHDTFG